MPEADPKSQKKWPLIILLLVLAAPFLWWGLEVMDPNQRPLNLYGRAVDQDGMAVSGATVELHYTHFNPLSPWYHIGQGHRFLRTDSQGFFKVSGLRGYSLSIQLSKEGYVASKSNFSGAYYAFVNDPPIADPAKPVTYLLQKSGTPVPLISHGLGHVLPKDGTPLFLDLLTFKTDSPNPDLKIQSWGDESHKREHDGKFDWRLRIEVLNGGGLKSTEEEFAYTAPETGYVNSAEMSSSITNKPWISRSARNYYLKLRDGHLYGQMKFVMTVNGENFCSIQAFLNPSGSRNLESNSGLHFNDMEMYNDYISTHPQAAK
jgi:hypothetical protein